MTTTIISRLRLSGIDEEDVSSGFVLSDEKDLVPVVHSFEAQIAVLDLLEHKPIMTGGYTAILHLHSIVEECEVTKLVWALDPKTKEKKRTKFVKSNSVCAVGVELDGGVTNGEGWGGRGAEKLRPGDHHGVDTGELRIDRVW